MLSISEFVFDLIIYSKHYDSKDQKRDTCQEEVSKYKHIYDTREHCQQTKQKASQHDLTECHHYETSQLAYSHMTDDDTVGTQAPCKEEGEQCRCSHPYKKWPQRKKVPYSDRVHQNQREQ